MEYLHENEEWQDSRVDFPQQLLLELFCSHSIDGNAILTVLMRLVDLLNPFVLLGQYLARAVDVRHRIGLVGN